MNIISFSCRSLLILSIVYIGKIWWLIWLIFINRVHTLIYLVIFQKRALTLLAFIGILEHTCHSFDLEFDKVLQFFNLFKPPFVIVLAQFILPQNEIGVSHDTIVLQCTALAIVVTIKYPRLGSLIHAIIIFPDWKAETALGCSALLKPSQNLCRCYCLIVWGCTGVRLFCAQCLERISQGR